MLSDAPVVFLLDVDNTLLDNDRFGADLGDRLQQAFGSDQRDRYWTILAALREELSYVDYLAALQKFRVGLEDRPELLQMSSFVLEYPFASRLYPRALEAVAHLDTFGLPVSPVRRRHRFPAAQDSALGHLECGAGAGADRRAQGTRARGDAASYPARHYVMIDDKATVLTP